ncbi:DUF454 domain-containing protein [bacterium]|nr:DUF454 domain-containing protein [bacterium]
MSLAVGAVCVLLGSAGIFIPLLPTTPFLLLAAWLFMHNSPTWHAWLMHQRWLSVYIIDYQQGLGLPLRVKMRMLILLWLTMTFTAITFVSSWWIRGGLSGIAVAVTVHILRLKTRETSNQRPG